MIHEYAIEPSVLTAWAADKRDYAEFLREYGLGTPRIVSSFPKKKANKLRSYFLTKTPDDGQSQQGMRYVEMVNKLVEGIALRDVEPFGGNDWCLHAKNENERIPFNVILSSEPIQTQRNITPDTMYDPDSLWNHKDQLNIQRTNEGIRSAVSNLLRLATEQVVVIDPYGWTDRAIRQMQYLINRISESRINNKFPSFSLFYKENDSGLNADVVQQRILARVNAEVGVELNVWELEEVAGSDVFHNRVVLTEHGGVCFGHGLGVSGEQGHTDDAFLIGIEIYQKKWKQFIEENCFHLVSKA